MIARSATTSTNARDITSKCFKIFTQNIHIDPLFLSQDVNRNVSTQLEATNASVSLDSDSIHLINALISMNAKWKTSAVRAPHNVLIPRDPTSAFAQTDSNYPGTKANALRLKMNVSLCW